MMNINKPTHKVLVPFEFETRSHTSLSRILILVSFKILPQPVNEITTIFIVSVSDASFTIQTETTGNTCPVRMQMSYVFVSYVCVHESRRLGT